MAKSGPREVTKLVLDGFNVEVDDALLIEKDQDGRYTWQISAILTDGTFFQPDDEVTARITLKTGTVLVGASYVVAVTEQTFVLMGWWKLNQLD